MERRGAKFDNRLFSTNYVCGVVVAIQRNSNIADHAAGLKKARQAREGDGALADFSKLSATPQHLSCYCVARSSRPAELIDDHPA